jgi:hypothetical protein
MENIVATLDESIDDDYTDYNICISNKNGVNMAKFEIDMNAIKTCDVNSFYTNLLDGTNARLTWHQQNSDATISFDKSIMTFELNNGNYYMCNCEFKIEINQSVIDVFERIFEIYIINLNNTFKQKKFINEDKYD